MVHVIPHASRIGGYERQGLLIACSQAARGEQVTIITHHADANELRKLDYKKGGVLPTVLGIRKVAGTAILGKISRILDSAADVAHLHALDPLTGDIARVAHSKDIPVICKVATQGDIANFAGVDRGNDCEVKSYNQFKSKRTQRLISKAWESLSECDGFIALNRAIADDLNSAHIDAEKIHLMPNAVRIPPRSAQIRTNAQNTITIGRLEARKRLDVVIDAFSIVRATHPNATLTIVGEGDGFGELRSKSVDGVRWMGAINDPQVALYQSDMFVFASELEGCPNALLEAGATGLPCLATAIPGVVEWFEDGKNAVFVERGDVARLAVKWVEILESGIEVRNRLGTAARAQMGSVAGLEVILERLNRLYESVRPDI